MDPTAAAQIAALAFLDEEAKKQNRVFLWSGVVLILLALGFPVLSVVSSVPLWVAGIMLASAGLLGGVCILLAFTRGSMLLAHLRMNPSDPVVHARFWVEVRRGARSLQLLGTTRGGVELHEIIWANAGSAEEQVIAKVRSVVPRVDG